MHPAGEGAALTGFAAGVRVQTVASPQIGETTPTVVEAAGTGRRIDGDATITGAADVDWNTIVLLEAGLDQRASSGGITSVSL